MVHNATPIRCGDAGSIPAALIATVGDNAMCYHLQLHPYFSFFLGKEKIAVVDKQSEWHVHLFGSIALVV